MNHIHSITFSNNQKFINYIGHKKRRTTWSHVEMLLRWITISNNLSNINGRLTDDLEELNSQLVISEKALCRHGKEKYTP